uniref:Uncharacterized protein n=1 Tax=Trichobilharzia regenti TaxID=157069 RepID=A0AA85K494_TRIRE|nr:unnamed protein product [Trichobilharzia regenti]
MSHSYFQGRRGGALLDLPPMGIETLASPGDENTDEATQAQQEAIENDMKSTCLISAILPLSTLDEDFTGHAVYLEKLKLMKQNYHGIRRLRRDEYLLTGRHVKEAARKILTIP